MVRWLDWSQVRVSYISDADLAGGSAAVLRGVHGLIFAGHDEYWTWQMRDVVDSLRDAGRDLAFLSGNNAYWNIRLGPGAVTSRPAQTVTCWRSASDPGATGTTDVTVRFRDPPLNRPENGLIGVMFMTMAHPGGKLPLVVADGGVGPEARRFLAAAGLASGAKVAGLVALEGDQIVNNGHTPPGLQVLFRSPYVPTPGQGPGVYHTTFYVAPSGGAVFASGTTNFALGLDPLAVGIGDERVRRLLTAVLDWMVTH